MAKICMISDDFLPAATGVGIHLQSVCSQLVSRGHEVVVITSRRKGQQPLENWKGVKVYRTFTMKAFGFYQALPSKETLRRILTAERPELVHHHYLSLLLVRAEKVARSLGIPQLYTYHMTADHLTQPVPMRPFRGLIDRVINRYCDAFRVIIAPSQGIARQVVDRGITSPVRTITNPVDFSAEEMMLAPRAKDSGFTLLYAGRLAPEKNLPLLLHAFAKLLARVPDSTLWIVGEGSERPALEALSGKLGISDQVKFLGYQDHSVLPAFYSACDVFVLPSLVETQAIVAMEAMAFAKPIIVTSQIASARELVTQGENGYRVDPSTPDELAQRLVELAQAPALRERMGQAGQRKSGQYRPETVAEAIEFAYSEALGSPVVPNRNAPRNSTANRDVSREADQIDFRARDLEN
ncbi:MAG: glycosyltransferase [Oligoflexia bacterium]|nr:glycosyltransferase [Oligoflexia bacterium]